MKLKKHQLKRMALLMAKSADALTDAEKIELAGLKALAAADDGVDISDEDAFVKAHNTLLTDAEKGELATLEQKGVANLDDDEKTKHTELTELAAAEELKVDSEFLKSHGDSTFTDDQLTDIVTKAVTNALSAGYDEKAVDKIIAAIKGDAAQGKGKDEAPEALTLDKVEAAIKSHLGGEGIDKAALVKEIKAQIPKQDNSLSAKALTLALDGFAKSIRQEPKMKFPGGASDADFPVEGRKGNLSVADAQLLNICLGSVSDEAIEKTGIKSRPTLNTGIGEDILSNARQKGAAQLDRMRRDASRGKALTTGGSGSGAELIPTDLSSDLQARMYLESQLATMLLASEVNMPTDPFKFPLKTTRTSFYVGSEAPGSDPTDGQPGTANITLDAQKLIGVAKYSYEADEDAIIPMLPFIVDDLTQGAANAFEGAVLNGDADGTHQDTDIEAVAAHHAKLFDGLRKFALADLANLGVDMSADDISAANFLAMKKKMKRWGLRPRDLIAIAGVNAYNDLIGLEETLTVDKVGGAARILTGDAPQLFGVPIVVSSEVREDLNASGIADGSVDTKGSIMMIHRPSFLVGVKRGFTVETEVDKFRQINSVIASFRRDFKPMETVSAAVPTCVMGYNYTA